MKKLASINNGKLSWEEISRLDTEYMKKHYAHCKINSADLLANLKKKGIKLAIISNNSGKVIQIVLDNNGGLEFDLVSGPDSRVDSGKTKSDLLKDLMSSWNLECKEMTYVGDHLNDIKSAKAAGVISVGVSTGLHSKEELEEYSPDILVASLDELRMHLK